MYREELAALGHTPDEFLADSEAIPSGQHTASEASESHDLLCNRPVSPPRLVHKMPFRYNPLHDLEALWWIAIYFPMARTIVNDGTDVPHPSDADSDQLQQQRLSAERLFWKGNYRYNAFTLNGPLMQELRSLHPAVSWFWRPLEAIRRSVTLSYRHIEQDMATREFDPPVGVYNTMQQELFNIAVYLDAHDVKVGPLSP